VTTFSARKKTREIIGAREYLKRRNKDPKSVEGAKVLIPRLGSRRLALFEIERDAPVYEVFRRDRKG
jgi:hypothetical protein